ncbi:MAG: MFS transporter [Oscillospiraceae bacterium]|jgi:OPA family glycerol-3-phosphate transporter-like MFS transporter|nr:MFS transporter [Oscillospiraceae bacterium]
MKPRVPERRAGALVACVWLVYMVSYLGRYNFGAAIGAMVDAGALSRSDAGVITSLFFFAYMVCQSPSAFVLRQFDPARVIGFGLALSAAANAALPFCPVPLVRLVWLINGGVQSALWPATVRVLTERLPESRVMRAMTVINTTTTVGTALVYLVSAACLKWGVWRYAFLAPAAILFAAALAWLYAMRCIDGEPPDHPEHQDAAAEPPSLTSRKPFAPVAGLITLPFLAMLLLAVVNGFIRDGVTTWLPTYVQDNFQISSAAAVFLSVIIPAAQTVGPFLAQRTYAVLKTHSVACAALYAAAFLSVLALAFPANRNLAAVCVCFTVCAVMITALNTALVCFYPMEFKGRAAQVSSVVNTFVYVGSIAATGAFGFLADREGWRSVVMLLCAAIGAACLTCVVMALAARSKAGRRV